MGVPSAGKTFGLRTLPQEKYCYLNTDLKEVPFRDKFCKSVEVKNATDILTYIPSIEKQAKVEGVVLDTLTFLMNMYERQEVTPLAGTKQGQQAWGGYAHFYGDFIHAIKAGTKDYIILAHDKAEYNEATMQVESKIPVKGAVGKLGVEGDFTIILRAMQVPISQLEGWENEMLTITPEEEEDGIKYVYQTRPFKGGGNTCRSPDMLWDRKMLYIDSDANAVLKRVKEYYAD